MVFVCAAAAAAAGFGVTGFYGTYALLGTALVLVAVAKLRVPGAGKDIAETKGRRLVTSAAAMLAEDPEIDARTIARRLEISVGWFARVFKAEMGMSLAFNSGLADLSGMDG